MNTFGHHLRISIWGESHGPMVGVTMDGLPPGLALDPELLEPALARRRAGAVGTTSRREPDLPRFLSGLHQGLTVGTPLTIAFENREVRSRDYRDLEHLPRPGHADLTAGVRSGPAGNPPGGGHLSGRLTLPLVAAGVVAGLLLPGVEAGCELLEAGGSKDIEAAVAAALADRDSIGGLVECRCRGLARGLGEPFFASVESHLAQAIFSIPGARALEFGSGFRLAAMRGSAANDPIRPDPLDVGENHAGGILGGRTTGAELVFRVGFKPTPTIAKPQETIDLSTGRSAIIQAGGRHDACFALRTPVIVEAVTLLALADLRLMGS